MFLETIADDDATGPVAEMYDADRAGLGYVANHTRVFSQRPGVHQAWKILSGAIRASMDDRRYELVTLAAARRLRSSYCMLAHGKITAEHILAPDDVREIAGGKAPAALAPVEVAVMALADKIADDATSVTASDLDRLRGFGLTDAEILDVVLTTAARCFFSTVLDAVGAEPDAVLARLDPQLRDALTVGRALNP